MALLLILVLTGLFLLYLWQRHTYTYWQRHNVKFIKPLPFVGNFMEMFLFKNSFYIQLQKLYEKSEEPIEGIYLLHRPAVMIRDLELIKKILITDFNHFSNRALKTDPIHDPVGTNNLFLLRNPKWKDLRQMLSPIYSSAKLKQMYPLMVEVSKEMIFSVAFMYFGFILLDCPRAGKLFA